MANDKKRSYVYAAVMGILTAIICLGIADGLFGIEGTIKDFEDLGNGYHTYTLSVNDPTGRYIFWMGLIGLPILFSGKIKIKSTWINLPIFWMAWYVCSWIFGEKANHRYLAHPARGWIEVGSGLEPFGVMILLWLIQAIVLLGMSLLRFAIRKARHKSKK